MAVDKIIRVSAETAQAEKSMQHLTDVIQEQKDITIEFKTELLALEKELANTSKTDLARQKDLKDQITQLKFALKDQGVALQGLNNEKQKQAKNDDTVTDGLNKQSIVIRTLNRYTGGLASEFLDLAKSAKAGGAAMKAALISTGVGALVLALGYVVSHWEEIKAIVDSTNKKLQESYEKSLQIADGLSLELDLLQQQEKVLNLKGESTEENRKKQAELNELLKKEAEFRLQNLKTQAELLGSKILEISLLEKAGLILGVSPVNDEDIQKLKDLNKQILQTEIQLSKLDEQGILIEDPDAGKKPPKPKDPKREKLTAIDSGLTAEEEDARLLKESKRFEELFGIKEQQNQALIEQALSVNDEIFNNQQIQEAKNTEAQKEWAERRKQIAFEEAEYKRDILYAEADILEQFGGLLQQLGEENKAIAVAGIIAENIAGIAKVIINTVSANAKAVAASPLTLGQPWVTLNTVAAGIGIASSVAAATKAISALGGGGSATGGSVPQGQQAAPSFNVVGTSGTNQIAQGLANRNEQPIQAYVVGSNITSQQSLDRNIVETATIG